MLGSKLNLALWVGLVVSGTTSALIVIGIVGGVILGATGAAARSISAFSYYNGRADHVIALAVELIGVPVLAHRFKVGFWWGLLATALALGWQVLPERILFALFGSPKFVLAGFARFVTRDSLGPYRSQPSVTSTTDVRASRILPMKPTSSSS